MKQRTLVILKPDAVERRLVGEIIARFEKKGFTIERMSMFKPALGLVSEHYSEHCGKPFYPKLINFMTSGPSIFLVVSGDHAVVRVRNFVGATFNAAAGTIRGDFSLGCDERNVVHASADEEAAEREIRLFFGGEE